MTRINGQPDDPGPFGDMPGFDPFAPAPITGRAARFWSNLALAGILAAAIVIAAVTCWGCIE